MYIIYIVAVAAAASAAAAGAAVNVVYFFLRSCVHLGQNHLPFGFVVRPTQAKWNHSMGH